MLEAIETGSFKVNVSISDGIHPTSYWAKRAVGKIMVVSETAPPVIREQAEAFKNQIEAVVLYYINEAVKDNSSMISKKLSDAGHPELANFVRGA